MNSSVSGTVKKHAEEALAQRLEGNELLKSGQLLPALQTYHRVLFALKGVVASTSVNCKPVFEDDDEDIKEHKEFAAKVKHGLVLTYLNMAAIQIKREQYPKALEYARACLTHDSANVKAKFREGQALIGTGQANAGRVVLEGIQSSLLAEGKLGDPIVHQALLDLKAHTATSSVIRGNFNAGAALAGAGSKKIALDNVSTSPRSPVKGGASPQEATGESKGEEQQEDREGEKVSTQ